MANARNSNQRSSSARGSARGGQSSRTTSRTGAWQSVKRHPILATAGVLAMGVGAYALMRKNGRGSRND